MALIAQALGSMEARERKTELKAGQEARRFADREAKQQVEPRWGARIVAG